MHSPPIIEAEGLTKRFGSTVALDGLDLSVPRGSVLGLLGPNGAGKTTAVSILTTLLPTDGGTGRIAGYDVTSQSHEVRENIGLSGQYAAVDEYLTGRENLELIGRLYRLGSKVARHRAADLLERFSLVDAADRPVRTYSGGMRRRLDLACALVAEPPVLFLDEPTTGLDPRSRNDLWDVVRDLVSTGTTVLLTTQYMEEADQLADSILVIDNGREIASGTADELKRQIGGERIDLRLTHSGDGPEARRALDPLAVGAIHVDGDTLTVPVRGGAQTLTTALRALDEASIGLMDVGLRRPSLDDVFLSLTGHASTDATPDSRELVGAKGLN